MSTRNILEDGTFPVVPGSTTMVGKYFSLTSTGGNQVKGRPLEPHAYTMTLTDEYRPFFRWTDCSTPTIRTSAHYLSYTGRAWRAEDTYALYGKLEEQYDKGDFNAAVFAGELGETADMLADRTKQLAKAILAARKGRFAQAAAALGVGGSRKGSPTTGHRHRDDAGPQHPQRVSQGWLELQYGWMPLMSDIYSLSKQIANADKPRKRRITARHGYKLEAHGSHPARFDYTGGGTHSMQIVAYVSEDIPSWPAALGLMDPEILAWELTPFSFVADWFLPIGNWLQARAFRSRAKGVFVTTEVIKATTRCSVKALKCPAGSTYAGSPQTVDASAGWYRYVYVNRTVSTTLAAVPLPSFSNGIGKGSRLENALALMASIFTKKL